MKLRRLFLCTLAAGALFAGCQEKEVDYGTPSLTVSPSAITFESSDAAEQVLTLNATRDWKVEAFSEDWIAVLPESGGASLDDQTVTISVLKNEGNDREATVTFTIGLEKKSVTIKQPGLQGSAESGDGTADSPYNVAATLALIQTLAADENSEAIYIKGIVSSIKEIDTGYGNATYYISDDGTDNETLYVFRGYYLNGDKFTSQDQIKAGDEVVIYGTVCNYYGNTPEVNQYNKLISINGEGGNGGSTDPVGEPEGDGTADSPYNVAATQALIQTLGTNVNSSEIYIKGIISSIKEIDTGYGNATYYISDDGTDAGALYVFRGYYLNGEKFTSQDQIKVGDEVVIYGTVQNYYGNTPEVNQYNQLVSINGKTEDDTNKFGVSATELNVSASATSATFDITGNVDWTVVSETDGFTVSPASGNGAGTVTVSFSANESGEARTATIKVSTTADVTTKEYTVALTQAAKQNEEEGEPISWVLGENAYDVTSSSSTSQKATVNGEERTDLLKLGTSSKTGSATLTIPAGTKKVCFYGIAWKNKSAGIKCSYNGAELGSQTFRGNDGATGNPSYTITVTDEDYYEFTVPITLTEDTEVTIESVNVNDPRVIMFDIKAYK